MLDSKLETLGTENAQLRAQIDSLQTRIVLLQNIQEQADKRFLAGIGKIIREGNPNFTSIMATLEPILKDQFDKKRLNDHTFINAFVSALQMAMQQAYTSRERERALDIQEQVENRRLDIESQTKNKQLDQDYDIALKELALKEKQVDAEVELKKAEMELKRAQIEQINQSIIDNRFIKSLEILSGIIGMALGANMNVPKGLWESVFDIVNTLLGKSYDKEGLFAIKKTGQSDEMKYEGKTYKYEGGVLMEYYEDRGSWVNRVVGKDEPAYKYFSKLTGIA